MATTASKSTASNGSSSSATESPSSRRLTAQQQRLQQMISMQHAHQDSMKQDYMKRSSSVGGGSTGTASPPASPPDRRAAPQPPPSPPRQMPPPLSPRQQRGAGAGAETKYGAGAASAAMGSSSLAPPTPTWGRGEEMPELPPASSFLGPAGATPTASNVSTMPPAPPPGRTAEYAKLLPGGGGGGGAPKQQARATSDEGGIHYHDYSQQLRPPAPTSEAAASDRATMEFQRGREGRDQQHWQSGQQQQQQQSQPMQPDLNPSEYYDAASHLPSYPTGYQSTGIASQAGGGARFNLTTQSSRQSEHQFHYGDPNHAFENQYSNEFPYHHPLGSGRHPYDRECLCSRCCRSCVTTLLTAENLHRSLCFGAIDGMLTGSGITAACLGLGLLGPVADAAHRWVVVALSLAACTSDGICMAVGHVWSTYVLQHASLAERAEERVQFARDRAASKARLVDMLLGRGMLKIDAMSVADTLEGYPDIFVSALVGDTGHALGMEGGSRLGSAENLRGGHSSGALGLAKSGSHGGGGGSGHGGHGHGQGGPLNPEDGGFGRGHYPPPRHHGSYGQGGGLGGRSSLHYGSYGEFDELRDDPDKRIMHAAMKDGWSEGAVMMLSFTVFSVIPSLTFLLALDWFPFDPQHNDYNGATSSTTVSVSIVSGIMLLLGIWKSYFFDSNWILFGLETMLVLLFCISSAYFIAAGLHYGIGRHFEM